MDSMEWMDYIIKLGSMVGAIGVLGNLLIKMYKKYVTDPDAKVAEKIQREYTQSLRESVEPLTHSIELLNRNLEESQADRKAIHLILEKHEGVLDGHDIRLAVLEDWKKGEKKE